MRVSTDPTDPAYIDDRPRRAWCNDVEIEGWTVADEFRRVVITPTKVHNGSVRVERLPDLPKPEPVEPAPEVKFTDIEDTDAKPLTELPKVKQEHWKAKRR